MNFLIIGYGLIGKERVKALLKIKELSQIPINIFVTDVNENESLPRGVQWASQNTFISKAPDWVFICTPHYVMRDWLSIVSKWESKILIEKPFGRNYLESFDMYKMLPKPENVFVGFNYRFYPAVINLLRDLENNIFGKIISVNMILGHGGSPDDVNSWKLNPILGAESALLDPGIHLLDIASLMFKTLKPVNYFSGGGFVWNTGIEEESRVFLLGDGNTAVDIQCSLVKWRNTFRIEVNGSKGYGIIEGKGKTYGNQTYTKGKKWGWKEGKPQKDTEIIIDYGEGCNDSFLDEIIHLMAGIPMGRNCTSKHAFEVMGLYNEIMSL